jgi:hypothetical protein
MEVKHSENIRLVGIEPELADGEKPLEYRSVLSLLHARVVKGNRSMPPGAGPPPCLQRQLTGVTHITDIGEGQIRLSPLMGTLETPRLIELDGPEPQTIEPSIHEVRQPRPRIFNQLDVGGTCGSLFIVAPARHPTPLTGRVSLIQPDLNHRSSRADLLEPRKKAGLAIVVRFNFHDHEVLT